MRTRRGWSLAVLLAAVWVTGPARAGDGLTVGSPAPAFAVQSLEHGEIAMNDLRGKVVLLKFWASWCRSCIDGLPAVKALYADHAAEGLEIIGISLDEDPKAARRAVAEHRLTWPQICDGAGKGSSLADPYEVRGTPRYVLIDRRGHVADAHVRPAELKQSVVALLAIE